MLCNIKSNEMWRMNVVVLQVSVEFCVFVS